MNRTTKIAIITGGIMLALMIAIPLIWVALSGPRGYYGYGMMGSGILGFGMMGGIGIIAMALFWGLIIWGIIALVRHVGTGNTVSNAGQIGSALDVLKRRYASGEINKQEFEDRKRELM